MSAETKPANIDLGKTRITDQIFVSSAALYRADWPADWWLVETWIFSDDPSQKTHQTIHGDCQASSKRALEELSTIARKVHGHIARNLMAIHHTQP